MYNLMLTHWIYQIGQGFALLCVSYPTADCVIKANAEELLS